MEMADKTRFATNTVKKPSSICMLVTGLGYGGADIQVANLARSLARRGWDVHLVALIPLQGLGERLKKEGFDVHSLEMHPGLPDPRALFKIVKLLKQWQPDVLHCHMVHANLLGRIARLFTPISVVISTAHNVIEGGRIREIAYRLTDPLTNLTTNVSHSAVRRYIEVGASPPKRIRMMPNGVDTSIFFPDKTVRNDTRKKLRLDNSFMWLAIGRFEVAKDYGNLLRAFSIARNRSKCRLYIVGSGSQFEKIKSLRSELGISDVVEFLGTREDIPALMNSADGYVMSSAWEGMPIVLLEAAASGLPIVATDVGGNSEVVKHEKSGFLCPPGNSNDLAESMGHMMALTRNERKAMGEAGREFIINNHAIEAVVDQWETIYRQLFASHTIAAPAPQV